MNVTIGNDRYAVEWWHDRGWKRREPDKDATTCEIWLYCNTDEIQKRGNKNIRIREIQDGAMVFVCTGVAKLAKGDNFSKDKGRKVSMTKALKQFSKPSRKTFWEEYFKMRGNKW
jgi:hypothetical protein